MERISVSRILGLATEVRDDLTQRFPAPIQLIGVPRGGIPAALAIRGALEGNQSRFLVSSADEGDSAYLIPRVIVEDIVVTGNQARRAYDEHQAAGIVCLCSKGKEEVRALPAFQGVEYVFAAKRLLPDKWVQFPWETADPDAGAPADAVRRLIEYVGDDPAREGLVDTPRRVLAYLDEVREGGRVAVEARTFASTSDDLLVVSGIAFSSLCEHHMLPYQGTAAVAYIPQQKLLGLSKIARIVQQVASGLTVQEDLTRSIAERVIETSGSPDVAVVIEAAHSCMIARGVRAVGSETLASAMLGRFRKEDALRAEALALLVRR